MIANGGSKLHALIAPLVFFHGADCSLRIRFNLYCFRRGDAVIRAVPKETAEPGCNKRIKAYPGPRHFANTYNPAPAQPV